MNKELSAQELEGLMAEELYKAIPIMNDVTRYPLNDLRELVLQYRKIQKSKTEEEVIQGREAFIKQRDHMRMLENAPSRNYLWPKENIPTQTVYTENPHFHWWHGPEFEPYFLEVLLPEDVDPVGAVICVGGNQLGANVINEAYQTCLDFNARGYQCFVLISRPHHSPWNALESGADVARCIQLIRANAEKYRIDPNRIALMGASNGGMAGENCIRFFSKGQKISDYFPQYTPDEADRQFGCQDVFLCIYGAHFPDSGIDYETLIYPPTFYAVGLDDEKCMANLKRVLVEQFEIKNRIAVHTFAGIGHGKAGWKILDGKGNPDFDLWVDHADRFMQDLYRRKEHEG